MYLNSGQWKRNELPPHQKFLDAVSEEKAWTSALHFSPTIDVQNFAIWTIKENCGMKGGAKICDVSL